MGLISHRDVHVSYFVKVARDFLRADDKEKVFCRVDLRQPGLKGFSVHGEVDDGSRPGADDAFGVDAGFNGEVASEPLDDGRDGCCEFVVFGGDVDFVGAKRAGDEGDVRGDAFVAFRSMPVAEDGDHWRVTPLFKKKFSSFFLGLWFLFLFDGLVHLEVHSTGSSVDRFSCGCFLFDGDAVDFVFDDFWWLPGGPWPGRRFWCDWGGASFVSDECLGVFEDGLWCRFRGWGGGWGGFWFCGGFPFPDIPFRQGHFLQWCDELCFFSVSGSFFLLIRFLRRDVGERKTYIPS